jgi:hypothetical protein
MMKKDKKNLKIWRQEQNKNEDTFKQDGRRTTDIKQIDCLHVAWTFVDSIDIYGSCY